MKTRRLVIKVGSSLVTNNGRGLDRTAIAGWAAQIASLRIQGFEVMLVSSGSIAEGMQRLGWVRRPNSMHELQAAAAVGQMGLVEVYESCFRKHDMHTAQILLTHADLADRQRYLNARSTLLTLIALNVIPIINENDTVVTDEIRFGDNDTLGALVTNLVEADWLVILTDTAGLFDADPRKHPSARLVQDAVASDPTLEVMAGGAGTSIGLGGMLTKVRAAKRAARSGADTLIVSGKEPDILLKLVNGERIGTRLHSDITPLAARKQWLADHIQVAGAVMVDAGAATALRDGGKSLLPVGVSDIRGNFERGAVVSCLDPEGKELARGLVNYGADELRRIAGRPSGEIQAVLGYVNEPEVIHRDNLVIL